MLQPSARPQGVPVGPQSTCHALDRGASTLWIAHPLGLRADSAQQQALPAYNNVFASSIIIDHDETIVWHNETVCTSLLRQRSMVYRYLGTAALMQNCGAFHAQTATRPPKSGQSWCFH